MMDPDEKQQFLDQVEFPVDGVQETCAICGDSFDQYTPDFASDYPNLVCVHCDQEATNDSGDEPFHKDRIDRGENPVFIDGQQCWRRYRFGGWITLRDDHDCDDLEEFYDKHFPADWQ